MNAILEKEALFGLKKKEPTEMEQLLADQKKAIAGLKQNTSALDQQVKSNYERAGVPFPETPKPKSGLLKGMGLAALAKK